MIYKYEDRYIVVFQDNTRASYSKKRYGELLEKVTQQAEKENKKVWNYYEEDDDQIMIYYWDQKNQLVKPILIDKDNKEFVYNYYWQLNCNGYAQSRTNGQKVFLHHLVMNTRDVVGHLNHNPLDNRRINLRLCNTNSDNAINQKISCRNTSGHVGVLFDKKANRWRGRFQYKYKEYQRYFNTYEEACEWVDTYKTYIIEYQKTFND